MQYDQQQLITIDILHQLVLKIQIPFEIAGDFKPGQQQLRRDKLLIILHTCMQTCIFKSERVHPECTILEVGKQKRKSFALWPAALHFQTRLPEAPSLSGLHENLKS